MNLSNNLFSTLVAIKPQKPDKQLLYAPNMSTELLLAQLRWCIDNNELGQVYKCLLEKLSARFGSYEINILVRRYKQFKLNRR